MSKAKANYSHHNYYGKHHNNYDVSDVNYDVCGLKNTETPREIPGG